MSKNPNQTDIIVGNNIRRIRVAKGMSQEKLGEALGITFQQVQKYEKGTNRVSSSKMDMICSALGCSLFDVFAGTAAAGSAPLSLPPVSSKAMQVAELFEKIESDETKAAIIRLLKSVTSHPASDAEAA